MATEWTLERRAQQSAKMKEAHAAKRDAAPSTAADPPAPIVNPPTTDDVVPEATPVPKPRRAKPDTVVGKAVPKEIWVDGVKTLILQLESLPLDRVSYADCGLLLNALSVASTALANARRQKQESLDAGTHRAPCKTCGRPIDISKSGGFQILTERDEHYQPRNVYYCSQNCLLARNMPSHRVKRLPGDAGAGT